MNKSKKKCKKKCNVIIKILHNLKNIIIISMLVIIIIIIMLFIVNDCDCKENIINNEIKNNCNDILIPYKNNLKDIIDYIEKNQSPYLTTSNCEYMNYISNITAKTINENLIDKGYAKIINNNLGILKYYCENNKLKSKIITKFLLNNFFTIKCDKLDKNIYTKNNITVSTLENLLQILNSLNKSLIDINLED